MTFWPEGPAPEARESRMPNSCRSEPEPGSELGVVGDAGVRVGDQKGRCVSQYCSRVLRVVVVISRERRAG